MSHTAAYSGQRDPINCPANQMSNEGEWTVESIQTICNANPILWPDKLADAHNSALEAEREKYYRKGVADQIALEAAEHEKRLRDRRKQQ